MTDRQTDAALSERLREAMENMIEDAQEVATRYHESMKGYRQERHDRMDADIATAKAVLEEAVNALAKVSETLPTRDAVLEEAAKMFERDGKFWHDGTRPDMARAIRALKNVAPQGNSTDSSRRESEADRQAEYKRDGGLSPAAAAPTHPNGLWMVYFEDASIRPEVFFGQGSEAAARERYAQAKFSWSCHLLSRIPDWQRPPHAEAADAGAPVATTPKGKADGA